MEGYIHSIETMGLVDGPGIRVVVFLQGCDLRCRYCHNPDSWALGQGKIMSAKEVAERLVRFKTYYQASGGGVTLSGGEPLLQPEFVEEILRRCKEKGIHTCIDTSGVGKGKYDQILQWTDLVLYDVKATEDIAYQGLTGQTIDRTKEFIEAVRHTQVPLWIRHVVVPGVNDSDEHMQALAQYVRILPNVQKVELLPYHTLGETKYEKMGIPYSLKGVLPMTTEQIEHCRLVLKQEMEENQ